MPLSSEITDSLSSALRPSAGHTPSSTTIVFSGDPIEKEVTLEIDASGIANADADTAYAALQAAVKTELDTVYLPDTLHLDTTGDNIDAIYTIKTVVRKNDIANQYGVADDEFHVKVEIQYE
jgi:hypothetical protein